MGVQILTPRLQESRGKQGGRQGKPSLDGGGGGESELSQPRLQELVPGQDPKPQRIPISKTNTTKLGKFKANLIFKS